jgi:hypothetical protein
MKERNLPSASKGCLLGGPEWAARLLLKFSSHAFIGVYRCSSVVSNFYNTPGSTCLGAAWFASVPSAAPCLVCVHKGFDPVSISTK